MASTLWDRLSRRLRDSAPYEALRQELGEVVRLPVAAAAWVGGVLARDLRRPLLVVVPREADALAWLEAGRLFCGAGSVAYFPAPSLSPYQDTETSLPVRAEESAALDLVLSQPCPTLVVTPRALFRRLPGPELWRQQAVEIRAGGEVDLDGLVQHLVRFGFRRSDVVMEIGELAVRGGVVDLYPPGSPNPVRLDLFGDTVESVRAFDATSQRSLHRLDGVRLLPLSLYPVGADEALRLADILEEELGEEPGHEAMERLAALRQGDAFPGWENYLPLAAPATRMPHELWPDPLVWLVEPAVVRAEAEHHARRLADEYQLRRDQQRFALPPQRLEHPWPRVRAVCEKAELRLVDPSASEGEAVDFGASSTEIFHGQLPRFPREVETARARRERLMVVCAEEQRQFLAELLEAREVPLGSPGVELVKGELTRGFRLPALSLVLYGEGQLLRQAAPERRRVRPRYGPFVSSLRDLKLGDYVVHTDHGIGQFVAVRSVSRQEAIGPRPLSDWELPTNGAEVEVMEIAYAGGKRLLMPLNRLDLVQKYSGIEGVPPRLDRLGGASWNRTKERVKRGMRRLAGDLLKLYAERQLAEAPTMPPDDDLQRQFEAAFEYEETEDQLQATASIKADLERDLPMDRLLCGDVGYGKTEVAMRAAFKVVTGGYQVALLAPTTILASQHFATFRRRFEGFPVHIEMLSRLRAPEEIRQIRQRVASAEVDILIGTHRLLSRDVHLPRLGLLVVDEEQRFGVAQKERLKELKKDVHVLAMTATPVPRTLQLSLAGVRDLSIIETPPKDRMAVETAIVPFSGELVREAIEFELERQGQVFYVYNRVESIDRMLAFLRELVPEARITVGHGQLDERELARRMPAFERGAHDVLLATTIIENGIDIPNVNTMIVHRADRFGLAQLYQLRGRVGRSNQLAYCYLLVPSDRVMSETARKRLAALREFSELGSGFRIAARDLEIRGAGNLLGAEQSGHISAVGIETYLKMLDETVRELKGEEVGEGPSTAIDLGVALAIPHDYIADTNLRMEIYRRIAAGDEAPDDLLDELRDRFGPPPPVVRTLLEVAELKRQAEELRVQSITRQGARLVLRLRQDSRVDPDRLIRLVSDRDGASFSPTGVLTLRAAEGEPLSLARQTLEALA